MQTNGTLQPLNTMTLTFMGLPENESFARVVISAFAVRLDPTLDVIADIKTAVSEAVTNAIVHGYAGRGGMVTLNAALHPGGVITLSVSDNGCGIADIAQAMQPFYTSQPEKERSGMGFSVMQSFMDDVRVESAPGIGTTVHMRKTVGESGE